MCSRHAEPGAGSPDALDTMLMETRKRCYLCESIGNIDEGTLVGGDFLCGSCLKADRERFAAEDSEEQRWKDAAA